MPKLLLSKPTLASGLLEADEFGRRLVETQDLDPVYVVLYKAKFDILKLEKFLLAYWCFYHCGTCSWIVDQPNYWVAMQQAAETSVRPRGTERRHFRGMNGVRAIQHLAKVGVKSLFDPFYKMSLTNKPAILSDVMKYVQTWPQFGPWIAFKVADMLERLGLVRINFTEADTFLFDSPKKGASLLVARYANGEHVGEALEPAWAFRYLEASLGSLKAPPMLERTLNGQEYETILCKYLKHCKGRYNVGDDLKEQRHHLLRFPTSKTSQLLLKGLPKSA